MEGAKNLSYPEKNWLCGDHFSTDCLHSPPNRRKDRTKCTRDAAWGNSYVLPVPTAGFLEACTSAGLTCWDGSQVAAGTLPDALSQQIDGLYRFYQDHKPEGEVGHGFGVFDDLGQDGVSVVLYHQAGADIRVVADSKTGLRIHSKVRDLFYMLACVAHSVWLLGALSLIAFHRTRFARRASRAD